ncbi:MAG TPA: 23S rRNA (adenine(2503)-C(2))-methyltransferase RlmN [Candidatus Limnocylindrales bacterium]|nr:23S rRNA (adenine(2503)-C(2))-methyltransferase RlmN [Candidatus Limnocylindrales bacterium]
MTTGALLPTGERPLFDSPRPGKRDPRPGLAGVGVEELGVWMSGRGEPAYRTRQVFEAIWSRSAETMRAIHVLPVSLRAQLDDAFRADTLVETTVRPGDEGMTEKALHRLDDGLLVESVLMRYPARGARRERMTVCISSQAGCAVGCPFCATGELGFGRDLDTAEIVDQVRFWDRRLAPTRRRVTNVVFMGMGEPLLNLDAVVGAASALGDPRRGAISARHLTISTSGVTPAIEHLAALRPHWTLAVSLHAARPALRDVLVPLNRRYPVDGVVAAAAAYGRQTGRRVSYEYVMIDAINDTPADAREVAALLRGKPAHVNLIPMNPVAHTPWQPSRPGRVLAFAEVLRGTGLATTIRRNRGTEIGAACGQLAAERAGQPVPAAVRRRRDRLETRSAAALAVESGG